MTHRLTTRDGGLLFILAHSGTAHLVEVFAATIHSTTLCGGVGVLDVGPVDGDEPMCEACDLALYRQWCGT